ncbi:MAG: hypothetical protein GW907_04705 [Betaproteobacteria bacterium]|nr:hypothetical protein [Betaproteobacteria bacterium]NCP82859.1 hypothetical protein [Rhodoferax sp.]NCS61657.1 hypothetical protein [Rhodoferax sp.]OIP14318.1 MAG: hypothetical protein AUK50_12015 [Comamonadaceae bacterium CG2_30_57_122]
MNRRQSKVDALRSLHFRRSTSWAESTVLHKEAVELSVHRLQSDHSDPFFTVFLTHSFGYEPANPAKTALAGVEFGYAALRERFDAESSTAS